MSHRPSHSNSPARVLCLFGWVVFGSGCGVPSPKVAVLDRVEVSTIELLEAPDGLSGLALDPQGALWAVAESERSLVRIDPVKRDTEVVSLSGVPDGIELESLTFLANGDLVLGTESEAHERLVDKILFARAVPGRSEFAVFGSMEVPYQMWGIAARSNQGIEGICAAGGSIMVVAESSIELHSERFAPIAVFNRKHETWSPLRLKLTTSTGKIAGLACQANATGISFVAIERHFGVLKILTGAIAHGTKGFITPTEAFKIPARSENCEGIVRLDAKNIAIVTDNFFGGVRTESSKLLIVPISKSSAASR